MRSDSGSAVGCMTDWTSMTLSQVVKLQRGHDLPATRRGEGSVPVIGSFGVTGLHDEAMYQGPGVAIGRSGASMGVATYCSEDYWPLNTCLFVKDFQGNNPRWIYYLLHSIDFSAYNSGSVQPMLNRNYIANMPIEVPPVGEQCAIAATLGAIDDKIESNRRMVDLSLALLDSCSADFAAKADKVVPLGDLVQISRESVNPVGFATLEVDHFSIPAFDDSRWPDRVSASSIMSNKLLIRRPCILVSRLNPRFNRTWWCVPANGVPALASTEFLVVSPREPKDLGGLWLALRDEYFRTELMRRVTGTSGSHQRIRPDDALAIEVPDTRLLSVEQKELTLSLLTLIHQRQDESRRLAVLRDTLLPELLSGRIRVSETAGAIA
ncbi:MAG: restriction endonuclease subunit S [Methylotetracoccus sp.]